MPVHGRPTAPWLVAASVIVVAFASHPAAAAACSGEAPARVSFQRQPGHRIGVVAWQASPKMPAGAQFRVYRNGAAVGQTAGHTLPVRVRPGRRHVFTVVVVLPSGQVTDCKARLRTRVRFYAPAAPLGLAATGVTRRNVTLVWSPGRRGDGRIAGYRVYKNGRVLRQVRRRKARVRVQPGRFYTFAVAARDTRGHLSHKSTPVKLKGGHLPPSMPRDPAIAGVTDTAVSLRWGASRPRTGRLAGYRVYRNGVPLRQVKGLDATAQNLAPATRYSFTVAAVDTLGYQSRPTRPLATTTAMPPPTVGHAHAFLLASTDESFRNLQRHYRQIGVLYPTYYDCVTSNGSIVGRDDPLISRWTQLRRILLLPRLNCQNGATLHRILTEPGLRGATIAKLVELAQAHGYDGINVDFEAGYATDRQALTSFVSELGGRLRAIGKRVSVEVSAKYTNTTTGRSGFYDYAGLAGVADYVFVMNWGWHWSTSGPGPMDDLTLTSRVADYVASMPYKERFILGTQFYGMDWAGGGGPASPGVPLEYSDIRALEAAHGATPVYNAAGDAWSYTYTDAAGVGHSVWYADAGTISRRIKLARDRALEVGFWRLGREDQRVWDDPMIAPGAPW
jgi:spore germination protein YaaH